MSITPLNENRDTTQKSTYKQEIVSEINDIEEIPEGTFPINLKWIYTYQRLEPRITAKYTTCNYQKSSFCGGSNIDLKIITCKDEIGITSKLKSYVVHLYHTYLLHPGIDRMEASFYKIKPIFTCLLKSIN